MTDPILIPEDRPASGAFASGLDRFLWEQTNTPTMGQSIKELRTCEERIDEGPIPESVLWKFVRFAVPFQVWDLNKGSTRTIIGIAFNQYRDDRAPFALKWELWQIADVDTFWDLWRRVSTPEQHT